MEDYQEGMLLPMDWKKLLDDANAYTQDGIKRFKQTSLYAKLKPLIASFDQWREQITGDIVGLDIGQDNIKLLKINKKNSSWEVDCFDVAPLPPGAVTKDEIKDFAAIAAAVKDMFKRTRLSSKQVALAIPRSMAIIKNINIDSRLNAEEIESRAWIEANRHFPDLIGDIYLDFAITGTSAQDPSQLELTLVACRKDHIKPYFEIARQAGLTVKIVDVDCYALERALNLVVKSTDPTETIALFNLDVNLSTLIVVRDHNLIYSHDQTYDGQRLLSQTEKYLNEQKIQIDNQEELLKNEGYSSILKENLISHLRHTIHFFYSSRPNVSINQIILSGECAKVPGLALFIENEIGVKTIIANPAASLKLAPNVDEAKLISYAPSLMLCYGLALSVRPD